MTLIRKFQARRNARRALDAQFLAATRAMSAAFEI
jgi:hypothetical protein